MGGHSNSQKEIERMITDRASLSHGIEDAILLVGEQFADLAFELYTSGFLNMVQFRSIYQDLRNWQILSEKILKTLEDAR